MTIDANETNRPRPVALTGDRTTGPLHLGHLAGSLLSRVAIQRDHDLYVMLADAQALSDNGRDPSRLRGMVLTVATDELAAGVDPGRATLFLQSGVPALSELTMLYLNLVTVGRLERNPTIRAEVTSRGFDDSMPAGFLCYPVAQAADITAFKATTVPVGTDQLPMIEQANEIAHRVNAIAGRHLLPKARALTPDRGGRLPSLDGRGKMSKSSGGTIGLGSDRETIEAAVDGMYTDPNHLRVSDPGAVEGNVVFAYLDAFDADREAVEALKAHYRRGGLGDRAVKDRLKAVLEAVVAPIRERRAALSARPDDVMDVVRTGTGRAASVARTTLGEVKEAFGLLDLS